MSGIASTKTNTGVHTPSERPGKPGGKRDANRKKQHKKIREAALELFLTEGIASTTIDQIVERAGVAKGSFYRYFADKDELVRAIMRPLDVGFAEAMDGAERILLQGDGSRDASKFYLDLARELAAGLAFPRELRLYLQEARGPAVGARASIRELADRVAQRAVTLSVIARDRGVLRSSNDPRISALTVIGAVERLIFAALSGEDVGPIAEVPRALVSVILDGVRAS